MKRNSKFLISVTLLVVSLSLITVVWIAKKEKGEQYNKVLTVSEVMSNPEQMLGKNIKVRGSIVAVDTQNSLLFLEDVSCCPVNNDSNVTRVETRCVNFRLPVRYSSQSIPGIGKKVLVFGKVKRTGKKFTLQVSKIDIEE